MSPKTIMEKQQETECYLSKLMNIVDKSYKSGKYNTALAALSSYCCIQYLMNQVYTDLQAEIAIDKVSKKILNRHTQYVPNKEIVFFYDGFGLDIRGWAISYVKAISELGYKLVYIMPKHAKGAIPHIEAEIKKGNGCIEYIDMQSDYMTWCNNLDYLFATYQPATAFFYTVPNDVAGAMVFSMYKGLVKRIQVDLTDHAFWIGTNAFDYATECRIPGASNLIYGRKKERTNILRIDPTPYICRDNLEEGFPFDIENNSFFFSGGALYKTLGDEGLLYYRIVDTLLSEYSELRFIYAGSGDDRELQKLIKKYPERAFLIPERKDFFKLFENCVFYLNTYPMFGGLMMRYAALAGKVPLTLGHSSDHEGILYEQEKRAVEFQGIDQLLEEARKLIEDSKYRQQRCKDMQGACLSEEDFKRNVRQMIEDNKTEFQFLEIPELDTTEFRKEYLVRLDVQDMALEAIANRRNKPLIKYYPNIFIKKLWRKINDKL